MKYNEKNKRTFLSAIEQLPAHEPPQSLWAAIEDELESDQKELALKDAVQELPTYVPPSGLWDQIEDELGKKIIPRKIFTLSRVAAAVALILVGSIWYFSAGNKEKIEIVYSQVIEGENPFVEEWDTDEADFEAVLTLFRDYSAEESYPDVKDLEAELEELNIAKEEMKEAIETFGSDTDLMLQLSEIERQRSEVIKRMASYI